MGNPTQMRRAAAIGTVLTGLAVSASAGAQILAPEEPKKAELATTGNDSELVDSVPIATSPGLKERVVMSLGPDQLPRLQAGDKLRVSGEVQVSTTCVARGPRCVGRRYEFNPAVAARLVLAGLPDDPTAASIPLSESKQVLCKQRRPNRNHHCTLTFPNLDALVDPAALPCPVNACYVNMILGASHRNAMRGNRVVLGADRPDGGVVNDKGRLNVVHSRSEVAGPTEQTNSDLVNSSLPLTAGKKVKRRVIHSIPVTAPRKGEVLSFDGGYLAAIDQLPFNTFIASRVILAESATATESTGLARSSVQLRGDATEGNGFNCTQGPSGYPTPCTVSKAGAIRITRDAVDEATGLPATLYVNLVSSAKALLARKINSSQQVLLSPTTGLKVARYAVSG